MGKDEVKRHTDVLEPLKEAMEAGPESEQYEELCDKLGLEVIDKETLDDLWDLLNSYDREALNHTWQVEWCASMEVRYQSALRVWGFKPMWGAT